MTDYCILIKIFVHNLFMNNGTHAMILKPNGFTQHKERHTYFYDNNYLRSSYMSVIIREKITILFYCTQQEK